MKLFLAPFILASLVVTSFAAVNSATQELELLLNATLTLRGGCQNLSGNMTMKEVEDFKEHVATYETCLHRVFVTIKGVSVTEAKEFLSTLVAVVEITTYIVHTLVAKWTVIIAIGLVEAVRKLLEAIQNELSDICARIIVIVGANIAVALVTVLAAFKSEIRIAVEVIFST